MTNFNTQQLAQESDPVTEVQELNRKFQNATVESILDFIWERHGSEMVIGTGFGPSGAVLMHKLSEMGLPIKVFYLDTHLLFNETYELRDKYAAQYGIQFERVSTDLSVDEQAKKHGDKLWESNPDKCCFIRKVLPLKNYLKGKRAWVTGVRRDQSEIRKGTGLFEWDSVNEVIKINPLAAWDNYDIWGYIYAHDLPYNPLHDNGYPSIGCVPCTHPADNAGDERSGRWSGKKKTECGIHSVTQQNYKDL